MKKIILILITVFTLPAFAQDNITIQGNISFDWVTKTQLERDENIEQVKKIIYDKSYISKYNKKDFKQTYKNHLKDENYRQHYFDIINGKKENETERMAGFFKFGDRILYAYGIQYKNDPYITYYYDALGNLRYIDKMSENYPNYPYYTHQYRITGELAGSFYFTSYDTQYEFKNGKFKGIWFKDTMFNANAKKIMTRTNY